MKSCKRCGSNFEPVKQSHSEHCPDCRPIVRQEYRIQYRKQHPGKFGYVKKGYSRMRKHDYSVIAVWCQGQVNGFTFSELNTWLKDNKIWTDPESVLISLEGEGYLFSEDDSNRLYFFAHVSKDQPTATAEIDEFHIIMSDHGGLITLGIRGNRVSGKVLA
jgi:hypothetical protein